MLLSELDWAALDRLRDAFLTGKAAGGPYWRSASDLASYDATFAERIGWKWDAALRELQLRGWEPLGGPVLDWGCGSGVAGRRVLRAFGTEKLNTLLLWDHSGAAMDFASEAAEKAFPGLEVAAATPSFLEAGPEPGLLLLSHVLNELDANALAALRRLILRSREVLWVEAGTHEVARGLQVIRDSLREQFQVLAPCPHSAACPMLAEGQERHWCHFFAHPPSEIFCNPDWVRFGKRAGIDLRSLPYSFLALRRRDVSPAPATPAPELHRVIGRAEHFKPYARVLACSAKGLETLEISKSRSKATYKDLEKSREPLLYRWRTESAKVLPEEAEPQSEAQSH